MTLAFVAEQASAVEGGPDTRLDAGEDAYLAGSREELLRVQARARRRPGMDERRRPVGCCSAAERCVRLRGMRVEVW
jgi:hypothetical protein